ncbi:MAG: YcjX family protein, partial [Alphaproteobacteria bacterium]
MKISELAEETADALRNAGEAALRITTPSIRLGVTGLARAGKTVFITSLVQNLLAGGRLPFLDAAAQGRILRAYLEPQPDDTVPRFDFEAHLQALKSEPPDWPESTRWLSQLRLTIEFRPQGLLDRLTGRNRLHVDIVDYPGEWLLDLPLLHLTYAEWSQRAVGHARGMKRRIPEAARWLAFMEKIVPDEAAAEARVVEAAKLFKAYLHAARDDERTLSTQPPGRFLMPGDLEGAPALTFCPLLLAADGRAVRRSYREMMERRFESYKAQVVKPFFRDHFARLDRQIVLVDALAAVNGGRTALDELKQAMTEILRAFRP